MNGVLPAEGAVFVQLQTVRGILLVLECVVVSLLALRAPQGDLNASAGFCCHIVRHLLFYLTGLALRAPPLFVSP